MDIIQSIILGIVQGASEFLPISSSGHLIVAPWFFGWKDNGLSFSVALHFGTLIAVIIYFWKDWRDIIFNFQFSISKQFLSKNFQKDNTKYQALNRRYKSDTLLIIAIATVPGVLAGLFLQEMAETVFRNPFLVAVNLFFWGLILFIADKRCKKRKNIGEISFKDGILIGLAQALAIIPGTSRSGITITAGLIKGLDRVSAARFSFLMLTPIVFGASLLEFNNLISEFSLAMIVGIIASAISGYIAIKYLIKFVERVNYSIFFWYRFVLATIIILIVALK